MNSEHLESKNEEIVAVLAAYAVLKYSFEISIDKVNTKNSKTTLTIINFI